MSDIESGAQTWPRHQSAFSQCSLS